MHDKTLTELKAGLQAGDFSSRELTEHFLERIKRHDGELNSFITVTEEQALRQADAADQAIAAGDHRLLTGLPIAHKDIFCTEGVRTSCGSRMLDNFIAPYTATAVEKMAAEGAVMLGKTNMDEFAMGSSNETSFYGPVKNPWDTERVPGGSSGGAAAGLAARLAPGATGTDTGGSIRQPAALNGVTGLKPTYGRVSRWGMIAFASSLDQAGPLGLSAADCALMLQAMAGHDEKDSTCLNEPVDDYLGALDQSVDGLKIGVPEEFFPDNLDGAIADNAREAMRELEKQGAKLVKLSLPSIKLSVPAYYVIAPAEASSNLSRFDGVRFGYRCEDPKDLEDLYKRSRSEGFGAEVKRRILVGTYALSAGYYDAYYKRAQKVRRLIRDDFSRAFKDVDVIMGPTSPETAFKLGAKADDPVNMYMADVFTIAVNLAGLPALSMPSGFINGLPAGTQVIGNYFQEGRILNVAHRYQMATDWHQQAPGGFA
ncbi:MAG: Asp-tRNA(Asn)/Glu-tRNA(Gln) amidotransferase subunit GatA [Alcanivorax sp.]|jgi:aspartyl-tRNA(Asn)/glutamyl-tRNA(Gln) amidotransferase subunit A|uniref:Asp-tRNA(Asn)/Glu-tRNA(Gln) amidotransferase subunit GatA n=1 Tax=Alloalcanivorax venustensis TaxID=172371 RepID=UPI000C55CC19|nr:Asp-tRNA(Asn)/Glu-tRNA(Gln) amidotransferase subunit GatA [Alcanivorax sp.]MED5603583.1 Asp-tRNA(Asn)/Glu-tRNA(Gln) amidotransferase subunit GatA [Pseudomonadota bacterium]SMO68641.1 aspartyl/glutamyl-tRNA(Asn/Gln) amidotransferase subunit A [Alcanivorax sp. DSM 26295]MBT74811.1 Asp-tRNA(Asn)/Glu-tRNA(Gln) amidotransferase GatCAB subunit A [Alcanivorax sp.]MEE3008918.1 Asp-tRNA(Asn)/Glu-tRNA(Gln) amidotransferase subunit GatA [Pseudomonadota bacterium]|tara:strand:+ start:26480 stop:27934 length:1455 start_codon:yes stop_codon:yes gene_type:complete